MKISFQTFSILCFKWCGILEKGKFLLQFKHNFLSLSTSSPDSNLLLSSLLTSRVVIPHENPALILFCKESNKFEEILKTFEFKLASVFPNKSLFSQRKQTFVSQTVFTPNSIIQKRKHSTLFNIFPFLCHELCHYILIKYLQDLHSKEVQIGPCRVDYIKK